RERQGCDRAIPHIEETERRRFRRSDEGRVEDSSKRDGVKVSQNGNHLIEMRDLTRTYQLGPQDIFALRGVDLIIDHGEYVAIMGPSGSGKSTLMNIVGCLDRPSAGHYILDGTPVESMNDDELAAVRNKKIGFVFQTFNLLSRTTA